MPSDLNLLDVEHKAADGTHTLVLRGELDMSNAEMVEAMIAAICGGGMSSLILDLSGLTFLDSTGLRATIKVGQLCAQHGHEFKVVPGPKNVQRVFEITGLLDSFDWAA